MINFLHTFEPEPILITIGPINIYWYGLFIVLGIIAAILTIFKLASYYKVSKDIIIDTAFWIIINGIIGARIYHVLLEFSYYLDNPLNIFKLWQGGLAIHGSLIAGGITAWILTKKNKLNFWQLAAISAPGLALAQAIGRWGNYFNQELFGKPTNLPWGIPIEAGNRISGFFSYKYFHPTFLYESIGNFIIFIILIHAHWFIIKKQKSEEKYYILISFGYLVLYSILRFGLEFIRIDKTPEFHGLRFPQIISLAVIALSILALGVYLKKNKKHASISE